MNKEFVVDVSDTEITIAVTEDKQLVELHKEQRDANNFSVGNIYLGRVKKVVPALNAAFVDVGHPKDAFLHYSDLGVQFPAFNDYVKNIVKRGNYDGAKIKLGNQLDKEGKIEDVLTVGQPILVQIAKEPISTKGPRVSTEISIACRNLVLLPFGNKVSISQRISSFEEKQRLRNLVGSIMPRNFGVIIRTAGEGKKVAALDNEIQTATDNWDSYLKKIATADVPCLIAAEIGRTSVVLRDLPTMDVSSIYVNDRDVCAEMKEYLASIAPEKGDIVKFYDGNKPIMEHFNLTKSIKSSFGKVVPVKNGIYLVIDHTEALHVIDVNSGIRTVAPTDDKESMALDVNMTAAEEIVRQLRLRDMGGIIVIDFIDLYEYANNNKLYKHMIELMKNDRSRHKILPLSKFGLMQITRQRVRPETHIRTTEQCPCCNGSGKIGPSLLFDRQLETQIGYFTSQKRKSLTISLHPYVYAYLRQGFISQLTRWRIKYRCYIKLVASQDCAYLEAHFYDNNNVELV
jgi:ribonuclease G